MLEIHCITKTFAMYIDYILVLKQLVIFFNSLYILSVLAEHLHVVGLSSTEMHLRIEPFLTHSLFQNRQK